MSAQTPARLRPGTQCSLLVRQRCAPKLRDYSIIYIRPLDTPRARTFFESIVRSHVRLHASTYPGLSNFVKRSRSLTPLPLTAPFISTSRAIIYNITIFFRHDQPLDSGNRTRTVATHLTGQRRRLPAIELPRKFGNIARDSIS